MAPTAYDPRVLQNAVSTILNQIAAAKANNRREIDKLLAAYLEEFNARATAIYPFLPVVLPGGILDEESLWNGHEEAIETLELLRKSTDSLYEELASETTRIQIIPVLSMIDLEVDVTRECFETDTNALAEDLRRYMEKRLDSGEGRQKIEVRELSKAKGWMKRMGQKLRELF